MNANNGSEYVNTLAVVFASAKMKRLSSNIEQFLVESGCATISTDANTQGN